MNKKLITWIDEEGYTCQKWVGVELTRDEQIAKDVAESLARTENLIFGYTWEQIQAKQQRK